MWNTGRVEFQLLVVERQPSFKQQWSAERCPCQFDLLSFICELPNLWIVLVQNSSMNCNIGFSGGGGDDPSRHRPILEFNRFGPFKMRSYTCLVCCKKVELKQGLPPPLQPTKAATHQNIRTEAAINLDKPSPQTSLLCIECFEKKRKPETHFNIEESCSSEEEGEGSNCVEGDVDTGEDPMEHQKQDAVEAVAAAIPTVKIEEPPERAPLLQKEPASVRKDMKKALNEIQL